MKIWKYTSVGFAVPGLLVVMSMLAGCKDANIGQLVQAGGLLVQAETLSEADEHQMGRSVTVAVTNQWQVTNDKALNDYVTLVGLTVSSVSPRPDYAYVFGVLDTDDIGAYSGPSGYIMITRGMIHHMRDEAELAGVLAHEAAHVAKQHGLQAVKDAKRTQAITMAASAQKDVGKWSMGVDAVSDVILKNGYTKPQEFDADADAVKYLTECRYDPNSYLKFLKRLDALKGDSSMGRLTSTHPGMEERIGRVAAAIELSNATGGATLRARFEKNTASLRKVASAQ